MFSNPVLSANFCVLRGKYPFGSNSTQSASLTIVGSFFAPRAHVDKGTPANVNGQMIAKSYVHQNGELHHHPFNNTFNLSTCDACTNNQITTINATISGTSNCSNSCCTRTVSNTTQCNNEKSIRESLHDVSSWTSRATTTRTCYAG